MDPSVYAILLYHLPSVIFKESVSVLKYPIIPEVSNFTSSSPPSLKKVILKSSIKTFPFSSFVIILSSSDVAFILKWPLYSNVVNLFK